ncbi:MAG: RluA family pseudouridine synthase [Endomicrobium sp.]|jgi:23S rRNA pseudouridine1911/1915/1917 synthase|nr:RluA family pseudouridine synthase [Endomicrobium sp.]
MQKTIIYNEYTKIRLDIYLTLLYNKYSRSYFQKLIKKQKILLNGHYITSSYKLHYGDILTITFDDQIINTLLPCAVQLDIIYEDRDLIIINKKPGIVVHPSYGHNTNTMLNALAFYAKNTFSPYLVHRLDKDTSGVIIFAKNIRTQENIINQFKKRLISKLYYAAVNGIINENQGIIKAPLGRDPHNRKIISVGPFAKKMSITIFQVIKRYNTFTLIKVKTCTGRTHQIRSHMKYIHHSIIGDKQYGGPQVIGNTKYLRQMLHAYKITFIHPSKQQVVQFTSSLPNDMKELFASQI